MAAFLFLALCAAATPARADMPVAVNPQVLQGAWAGGDGANSVILMFMGDNCALGMNGQQMYGIWRLAGNRIDIRFQNGQTQSYTADIQGDALILDGRMRLARQAMSGMPRQQGGGWGQPQRQTGPGPLEGRWVWVYSKPDMNMGFVFSGGRFSSWMTGRPDAAGTYELSGSR